MQRGKSELGRVGPGFPRRDAPARTNTVAFVSQRSIGGRNGMPGFGPALHIDRVRPAVCRTAVSEHNQQNASVCVTEGRYAGHTIAGGVSRRGSEVSPQLPAAPGALEAIRPRR